MFLVVLIRCVRLSQGCNHFSRLSVGNKVDMVYYNLLMVVFDSLNVHIARLKRFGIFLSVNSRVY